MHVALLTAALLIASLPRAAPGQVVRVFLLAGQSNMVGADAHPEEIDRFPPFVGAGAPQPKIRYWYLNGPTRPENGSGRWVPLQPDARQRCFGPELTFGRRVAQHERRAPIAIIKSAWGGTTLAHDWDPDAPSDKRLYERTMRLVDDALGDLRRRGVKYRLEAVLWHQGENDMLDPALMTGYGRRLEAFIARWRKDLKTPDLKWFVGEISDRGIWGLDHRRNMQVVRAQQRAVCDADPRVWWVPTSHLAFAVMSDGQPHYHFGTEGQLQHGEAYADAYLATLGRGVSTDPAPFRGQPVTSGQHVRMFVVAGQRTAEGEGSYVAHLARSRFKPLAKPQRTVRFSQRLGDGDRPLQAWTALGPVGSLGTFGPELSIGDTLARHCPEPIALVKTTDGAAVLQDWLPEPTNASRPRYEAVVRFIKDAAASLEKQGARPTLDAVFWIPGEHDAYWGPFRSRYAEDFTTFIAALRRDLDAPELRFVVAELSDHLRWGPQRLDALDAQIQRVANGDPLVHWVDTDDLPAPDGGATLGADGTVLLGRKLARAYLEATR